MTACESDLRPRRRGQSRHLGGVRPAGHGDTVLGTAYALPVTQTSSKGRSNENDGNVSCNGHARILGGLCSLGRGRDQNRNGHSAERRGIYQGERRGEGRSDKLGRYGRNDSEQQERGVFVQRRRA